MFSRVAKPRINCLISLSGFTRCVYGFCGPFEAGLRAMERKHYATAMRAWRGLAKEGVPQALNNIGHLYEQGYGVSQDYSEAMNWYKQAASKGLAEAEHNVGMLYNQGFGVAKNDQEAVKWFRRAAKQELPDSQYSLVLHITKGAGSSSVIVRQNLFFLKAAKRLFSCAVHVWLHATSRRGWEKPDSVKALIWASIALKNGQKEAQDLVNIAKLLLEESEVMKPRKL